MASKNQRDSSGFPERRIVLLGKTGAGKSSLANNLIGENVFTASISPSSVTAECQSESKLVRNINLTVIDTPGLLDTKMKEEDFKSEIINCIVECSPGPHAFLIVLQVGRYTGDEQEIITRICELFSEDVLRYSVIVFTYGDQLDDGTTIKKFVTQNEKLKDLVENCDGRCHVFDTKYWKNNDNPEEYRRNSYQLEKLLDTLDRLVARNREGFYTNRMLKEVHTLVRNQEESIRRSGEPLSPKEAKKRSKKNVVKQMKSVLTFSGGILLKVFLGYDFGLVEKGFNLLRTPPKNK